jgi:TolB-like protein/DNA-binding winged helix-turn-helix (wHTH) protein
MASPGKLRIGDWCVDPNTGLISRAGETVRVEARTMRLLLDLADHRGEVVSIDELLDRVWAGVIVTPDSVYQAVTLLRRLLGDDPKRPSYIATVPRLGYRMVAEVTPWTDDPAPGRRPRRGRVALTMAVIALVIAASGATLIVGQTFSARRAALAAAHQPVTVGVLAFLDLTPDMDQLPLADDVTEGLIDKLAKNPRLRTPGFRASFNLRGRHLSPAQASKALGVAYLVDGSIRRQGDYVRIAARLIRADNGFVVWSQDYFRPVADTFAVQDAIAASVSQALAKAKAGET